MKILSYQFNDIDKGSWNFQKIHFKMANLIVGDSATGKSMFLNTIFNVGSFIRTNAYKTGHWVIEFEHENNHYEWEIIAEERPIGITLEKLSVLDGINKVQLIDRQNSTIIWKNDKLPKLSNLQSCINILQNEDDIKPIYEAFALIMQRRFEGSILQESRELVAVPVNEIEKISKDFTIQDLFTKSFPLNIQLYCLKRYFKPVYEQIKTLFMEAFPYIESFKVVELKEITPNAPEIGLIPTIAIKEKNLEKPILQTQFSSGMLKLLLLITDIYTMPNNTILLIDEYENSLGMGPINFFPNILDEMSDKHQVIMTSHHPYIINNMPISNWYVFARRGAHVDITYGSELEKIIGKSKQDAFLKLINHKLFSESIR